ncbi:MAG: site-2 protease family protein [Anaerolineae bacterium]|nr:site-2 protease family protein [Anaerolineae bacterium]
MRPQYYYEPPRHNWAERLKPLKEPPLGYLVAFIGIILGIYLATRPDPGINQYGPRLLILLIAFPIHELAHALTADRLGDSTPRYYGRITLNPLAQLNFIGSFLMIVVGLGWAYVPINPSALRPNPRSGHMIVAVAGPISNLILAVLCAILWYSIKPAYQILGTPTVAYHTLNILFQFTTINLALFLFNLVPIAPLDGFFVLKGLLPYQLAYQLERIQRYGLLIFLAVFFIAPLLGLPIVNVLIFRPAGLIARALFGLA